MSAKTAIKRGDLVNWVTHHRTKHWLVVKCFKKGGQVYGISDFSGAWYRIDSLEPTTVENVIAYCRRKWGDSAAVTRSKIAEAYKRLKW